MPFTVEKCTEADLPRFFEIVSLAFRHDHEYIDSVFPDHDTPAGREAGAERMLATMKADINAIFLKVVNDERKIIAAAKWNIYDGVVPPKPELTGDYWKDGDEKEFAKHMFDGYLVPRCQDIKDSRGNLATLDMLIVDPYYQRQGAGRMLVQWGTAVADRLGVEAVVEAGDYGRGLYAQEGFEVLDKYEVPVPEKWAARRKQWFWWMKRPALAPAPKN
ncbi:acyl-CoA N-acyltransferase [Lindgomyces ingoldianus]|uniref:Acyl-CoA N-acyltransferase n=1 Tax=Lindgomyces ingoldianus TaxID=673940 RepID=A0ACB6Q772_9PLEO|nr:acyl-CoA N-acyltransferase [Lindgomyces ingoldianus]KAF2462809.1 acyl-CoA N-acyltransferase [Lindgomyces ingoldianus]